MFQPWNCVTSHPYPSNVLAFFYCLLLLKQILVQDFAFLFAFVWCLVLFGWQTNNKMKIKTKIHIRNNRLTGKKVLQQYKVLFHFIFKLCKEILPTRPWRNSGPKIWLQFYFGFELNALRILLPYFLLITVYGLWKMGYKSTIMIIMMLMMLMTITMTMMIVSSLNFCSIWNGYFGLWLLWLFLLNFFLFFSK